MGKLKAVRRFLKEKGFHLNSIGGCLYFLKRGVEFICKYRLDSLKTIKRKWKERPQEPPITWLETFGPHNHISHKIRPRLAEYSMMAEVVKHLPTCSFSVIVSVIENGPLLLDTLASIDKQICPPRDVFLITQYEHKKTTLYQDEEEENSLDEYIFFSTLPDAVEACQGEYILFLEEGDILYRDTFYQILVHIASTGTAADVIYADHDYIHKDMLMYPFYKPAWSPDLLTVKNYICRSFVIKAAVMMGLSADYEQKTLDLFTYDLLLKAGRTYNVDRIEGIIVTFRYRHDEFEYSKDEDEIRRRFFQQFEPGAILQTNQYYLPCVRRQLTSSPKVSIIIPTCFTDCLITTCIESIIAKSSYHNYEIIVIDNSRKNPKYGQDLLTNYPCKILYINEKFNWARLNNLAVQTASGDLLLFLNDDTEVITSEWLETLSAEAVRSDIGVVGPLLLFPNGKVQSAGTFLTDHGGCGRHYYLDEDEKCEAWHNLLHYRRECSCLTGACFIVEKRKFDLVQGFNEAFDLIFNDSDFCLRLSQKGFRNLFIPEVKVLHKEKASRATIGETDKEKQIWNAWGTFLYRGDPYYNRYLKLNVNTPAEEDDPVAYRLCGGREFSTTIIKKILLVKLDHIGDMVMTLPTIRKVRALFPQAQIDILCGPWSKPVLEMQPELDHIITYSFFNEKSQDGVIRQDSRRHDQLVRVLKKEHYDLAVHLRCLEETRYLAENMADYSLGFAEDKQNCFLTHPVIAAHDIAQYKEKWSMRQLLHSLVGYMDFAVPEELEIKTSPEIKKSTSSKIAALGLLEKTSGKILIGIHAGVGSYMRAWPFEKYAILCDIILERLDAAILLLGGKAEIQLNEQIMEQMRHKENIWSVAGTFSLVEFSEFVKILDYFIGNNSGPMHIVGTQGVPTVGIFSGVVSETEWSPAGRGMTVSKQMGCAPCYFNQYEQCPHYTCMNKINPFDIYRGLEYTMIAYPRRDRNDMQDF